MNSSNEILLKIRDLIIEINDRKIVECDEFILRKSDKILLTAASGEGKTIFLRCISGLLDVEHVKKGLFIYGKTGSCQASNYSGYVKHQPLTEMTTFVFQDAMNSLHPYRPIKTQISRITAGDNEKMTAILREFGLAKKFDRDDHFFSHRSSGGECQRISLMHIHDGNKDLLLLDEPLTDIDHISRHDIEILLKSYFAPDNSITSILVSHDTDWIKKNSHIDNMRHITIEKSLVKELDKPEMERWIKERASIWKEAQDQAKEIDAPPVPLVTSMKVTQAFGFHGRDNFRIWKSPTIELHRGEIVGLLGESGSGKSVLLRCCAGLQPKNIRNCIERKLTIPSSGANGQSQYDVIDISQRVPHELANTIQYIFQNNKAAVVGSRTIYMDLKDLKHEALEQTFASFDTETKEKVDRNLVRDTLDKIIEDYWKIHLNISADTWEDQRKKRVSELSLGMLRRYSLLRALIKLEFYTGVQYQGKKTIFDLLPEHIKQKPRILLADEISRGLDQNSLVNLIKLLKTLKSEIGLSVILVSHELRFIEALADKVFVIVDGYVMPTPLRGDLSIIPGTYNPYYDIYKKALDRNEQQLRIMENRTLLTPQTKEGCIVHSILPDGCPNHSDGSKDRCIADQLVQGDKSEYGVCD